MKKVFFNMRTNYGVETVDELNRLDFETNIDFKKEVQRLKQEYRISGMSVYTSQRSDKTWNN